MAKFPFPSLLKSVFDKLFFWKESFSNKAWALEKMKDVFRKELDLNPDQIKIEDFVEFLQSFFDKEDGNSLVEYPDFVMNALSKMITSVIVSPAVVHEKDLTLMFKLLRSAVTYGRFEKGQRVSTMFDCLKCLLTHKEALGLMMSCQFDASLALLFAVGGKQNYTRKSAEEYFTQLVKVAFNESDINADFPKKARTMLRDTLTSLFGDFNESLVHIIKTSSSNCSLNIVANYCKVLSLCSESSLEWGRTVAFSGSADHCTFNIWCDSLKHLVSCHYCDIGDVVVPSVNQLAVLSNQRRHTAEGVSAFQMLYSLVVLEMAKPSSGVSVSDLIAMAHSIVTSCNSSLLSSDMRQILLELSVLPLSIVLGVPVKSDGDRLRHVVEITKEELEKESKGKRSPTLITRALINAFSLSENHELDDASDLSLTIKYVTLKTLDPPGNAGRPFLQDGVLSDRRSLACLISAFTIFKGIQDKPTHELKLSEADIIQMYVARVLNVPGISHRDLTRTLECYRALLRRLEGCGTPLEKDCLQSVVESLELHLVNVDPNLRETAVRELGHLYLLESAPGLQNAPLLTSRVLPSLWQCVRDKDENVITQVFEFVLRTVETGGNHECLKAVLDHLQISKEELMTELQASLLSRQWENIKPVAFSLYSSLAVPSNVVRYAEVCLQSSGSLAAPVVFNFIDKLFKKWTENDSGDASGDSTCDLEGRVTGLCNLFLEGWGDILLISLNGDNTTCLRYAVDILVCLNQFVIRADVCSFIDKKLKLLVDKDGNGNGSFEGKLESLTKNVISYSKSVLEGSFFLEHSHLGNNEESNFLGPSEREEAEVMNKIPETGSEPELTKMEVDIEKNGKVSSTDVFERFDHTTELEPFVLSEKPFYLPHLVSNVLSVSSLDILLIFSAVKELLANLPLQSMQKEVYRSTDEYDRSSTTILQDINNSLDASFKVLSHKLEKEILEVFMTEVMEILDQLTIADSEGLRLVKEETLAKLSHQMKDFSVEKESFIRFVLSMRRNVIIGETQFDSFEIGAKFLKNGLAVLIADISKDISTQSYFASSDGIKKLLNMYEFSANDMQSHTASIEFKEDCSKYCGRVKDLNNDSAISSGGNSQIENGNFASCAQPFTSEAEIQQAVEDVQKSRQLIDGAAGLSAEDVGKETTTLLLFQALQRIVETCRQCVRSGAQGDARQQECGLGVATMVRALGQMKEEADDFEDGFVGDNDPTAIDCY